MILFRFISNLCQEKVREVTSMQIKINIDCKKLKSLAKKNIKWRRKLFKISALKIYETRRKAQSKQNFFRSYQLRKWKKNAKVKRNLISIWTLLETHKSWREVNQKSIKFLFRFIFRRKFSHDKEFLWD